MDECLFQLAKEQYEPGLCLEMEDDDYKETCFFYLAYLTRQPGLCSRILAEDFRQECFYHYGARLLDMDECRELGGKESELCLLGLATRTRMPDLCKELGEMSQQCSDDIQKNEEGICKNNISDVICVLSRVPRINLSDGNVS